MSLFQWEEVHNTWQLAQHSQWGLGVLLINTNNFIEHQHQSRVLWDHDRSRQKQNYSVIMSEPDKIWAWSMSQNINDLLAQTTWMIIAYLPMTDLVSLSSFFFYLKFIKISNHRINPIFWQHSIQSELSPLCILLQVTQHKLRSYKSLLTLSCWDALYSLL